MEDQKAAESLWETSASSCGDGGRGGSTGVGERELATAPTPGRSGTPSHSPLSVPSSVEAVVKDDMNSYISQYYNGPSSGKSVLAAGLQVPEPLCGPGNPSNRGWGRLCLAAHLPVPVNHNCRQSSRLPTNSSPRAVGAGVGVLWDLQRVTWGTLAWKGLESRNVSDLSTSQPEQLSG